MVVVVVVVVVVGGGAVVENSNNSDLILRNDLPVIEKLGESPHHLPLEQARASSSRNFGFAEVDG